MKNQKNIPFLPKSTCLSALLLSLLLPVFNPVWGFPNYNKKVSYIIDNSNIDQYKFIRSQNDIIVSTEESKIIGIISNTMGYNGLHGHYVDASFVKNKSGLSDFSYILAITSLRDKNMLQQNTHIITNSDLSGKFIPVLSLLPNGMKAALTMGLVND